MVAWCNWLLSCLSETLPCLFNCRRRRTHLARANGSAVLPVVTGCGGLYQGEIVRRGHTGYIAIDIGRRLLRLAEAEAAHQQNREDQAAHRDVRLAHSMHPLASTFVGGGYGAPFESSKETPVPYRTPSSITATPHAGRATELFCATASPVSRSFPGGRA
jgi:hypothetical protein